MDYMTAFDISATGMTAERLRLDVTAVNIANANTTRGTDGSVFTPLRVVTTPKINNSFGTLLESKFSRLPFMGTRVSEIVEVNTGPRLVFDPGHPDADNKGFVSVPNINPVSEMVNLITATRAYEANVRAFNAAKSMTLRALEIGE